MATYVHITAEAIARKAKRNGLRVLKSKFRTIAGVFAMPVVPNFQISHQWLREMKQWRPSMMTGVYFRIPDHELVWVGRYSEPKVEMTAAQAAAHVMAQTTMSGVEVIVPRRIGAKEIVRIRSLPQLVGWRHYPEAHGKRPWACTCCQRGAYNSRKIRERLGNPED